MCNLQRKPARLLSGVCLLVAISVACADDNALTASFKITNGDTQNSTATSTKTAPKGGNTGIWSITDAVATHAKNAQGNEVPVTWTWHATGTGSFDRVLVRSDQQSWSYYGGPPSSTTDGAFTTTVPVASAHTAQRWKNSQPLPKASAAGPGVGIGAGVTLDGGPGVSILGSAPIIRMRCTDG
jgi:hypothetical protein